MNTYDVKAEQQVISSLINNFTDNSESFILLDESDFFETFHKRLFRQIFDMHESGETISPETFLTQLKTTDRDSEGKFLDIITVNPSSSAITIDLAKAVKNFSLLRKLQQTAKQLQAESGDPSNDSLELVEQYSNKLLSFIGFTKRNQPTLIGEIIPEVMERIDKIHRGEEKTFGLATNLKAIDEYTSGIEQGQLVIIAARPSIGKTALMLTIAKNITTHTPALVFSLEMTSEELGLRLLTQISGVSYYKLKSGHITQADAVSFINSSSKLQSYKMFIDPTSSITIYELRSKIKKMIQEHGIKCVFIDYLQLMSTPKMQTRDLEIGYITRSLKAIAKDENIPIILLSQLNRAVEARADKIPVLSDLRESGNIEQDADVVIFIHRDKFAPEDNQTAEIIIAKNRNGAIGAKKSIFLKETMTFADHYE